MREGGGEIIHVSLIRYFDSFSFLDSNKCRLLAALLFSGSLKSSAVLQGSESFISSRLGLLY